jgi:hypothetical protein
MSAQARREEIAAGLYAVRTRIANACIAAGRRPEEITLVVVTKTFPAQDVRHLADLGVRDIGENRDQEARLKSAECADLGLTWHFIGQLQTNKATSVARYADVVHSVDRPRLVHALAAGAAAAGRTLDCLVQVSLDADPARGGVAPSGLHALADAILAEPGLRLRGLMAVAPLGVDPAVAFAPLPGLRDRLASRTDGTPIVSAGMSADLEAAVACGATHLRVGSAVLGRRPPLGYRRDAG